MKAEFKKYEFNTEDQHGDINTYSIECASLKEAINYKREIIGNSVKGEKSYGHVRRYRKWEN